MRLRTILLFLVSLAAILSAPSAFSATTPTEAKALQQAATDKTAYTLPPDKLAQAVTYAHTRLVIHIAETLWGILTLVLILALGIAARMRTVAVNLSSNRWAQGFTFFAQFLLLTTLLSLPFDLYSQHLALHYGMSVQHWPGWFADQAKGLALVYFIGGMLVMLLFRVIRKSPRLWWFWFWIPTMCFVLIGVFITPYVIDPLFNKFEPLTKSNPALVDQLEKVVARGGIEIPPTRMFLMKASDKVTTLNAYVTGFGASKRVVVWDTSIAKGTPDEILFIFGHEMGHYVLGHIVRGILFSFVFLLIEFWLGYLGVQALLRRYGAAWGIPSQDNWGTLVVLFLVVSVVSFFATPIQSTFTRAQEHAADVYGQEVIHGIVADPQTTARDAFRLLGENSLDDPYPSPLLEFWAYSHPSISHRAAFAIHYDPWSSGEAPKYFPKTTPEAP